MRTIVILFLVLGLGACGEDPNEPIEEETVEPNTEGDEEGEDTEHHHAADEAAPADHHGGAADPPHEHDD